MNVFKERLLPWKRSSSTFLRFLSDWFAKNARPFPWRKDYSPYAVWISEMMLQQTQADRGSEYFTAWIRRFPDIHTLSRASEQEVLHLWQGLGYYRRARYILQTARLLCKEHDGRLPAKRGALLALPGIGPYTAHAILSIAYNLPYCVIDGNVLRVWARLLDIPFVVDTVPFRKELELFLEGIMKGIEPRLFNEALMELGALICTPTQPSCGECPVSGFCESYRKGTVAIRPVKKKKTPPTRLACTAFVVSREGRYLLQRFPPGGLFANMWGFPIVQYENKHPDFASAAQDFQVKYAIQVKRKKRLTSFVHSYTRYKIHLHALLTVPVGQLKTLSKNQQWLSLEEIRQLPMPSAHHRIWKTLKGSVDKPCSTRVT